MPAHASDRGGLSQVDRHPAEGASGPPTQELDDLSNTTQTKESQEGPDAAIGGISCSSIVGKKDEEEKQEESGGGHEAGQSQDQKDDDASAPCLATK